MKICQYCQSKVNSQNNLWKHQQTIKCKLAQAELEKKEQAEKISQLQNELQKYKVLYEESCKNTKVSNTTANANSHNTVNITNNNVFMQLPPFNVDTLEALPRQLDLTHFSEKPIIKQLCDHVTEASEDDDGNRSLICTDLSRIMLHLFDGYEWKEDPGGAAVTAMTFQFLLKRIGDKSKFVEEATSNFKKKLFANERVFLPEGEIPESIKREIREQVAKYRTRITQLFVNIERCAKGDTDNKLHKKYHNKLAPRIRGKGKQRKAVKKLCRDSVQREKEDVLVVPLSDEEN